MDSDPEAPQTPMPEEELPPSATIILPPTPTYGGRFVHYNFNGNIFEVTSKYKPPTAPIGKGAYGVVCAAWNSETNTQVAIKKIANTFSNRIDAKKTLREIKILRHLEHDNIVRIRDIIPPPERGTFKDVYIVYDLMNTDLHQVIHTHEMMTEEHLRYFLYQILRGLKYIHSAKVLHRDLKPSNIILNNNCDLKICDFGLARVSSDTNIMTEYVVTRWYRAPELLLKSKSYTTAIDMWSVGCIFMEMANRKALFPGKDQVHQLRLHLELLGTPSEGDMECLNESGKTYMRSLPPYRRQSLAEKFPHVPPLALDLVEKMLAFDPRQRITAEKALEHPYLDPLHDSNDEPVCLRPFNDDFERRDLNEEQIKEMIYREAIACNPNYINF